MKYTQWHVCLLLMILLVACTVDQEPIDLTRVAETAVPPTMTPTIIASTSIPATMTPTAVVEVLATETAVPTATNTLLAAVTVGTSCARPEDIEMTGVAIVIEPVPCLVWQDITDDESGFIVEFFYRSTGEHFQEDLPADSQQWLLPYLLDPCNYRYEVQITAMRANDRGNRLIASQEGLFTCPAPLLPAEAAQQLQNSLLWQESEANLYMLTGWTEGYRRSGGCGYGPYRWLDESHIMLFPIVGYESFYEDPKGAQVTQPFVLNVATGQLWTADQAQTYGCESAVYSSALEAVIESRDGLVRVRNLAGEVLQTYVGGNPLHMGETGLRLLAGDNWIDLETGQTIGLPIDEPARLTQLAWTDQDTRFYDCCISYSDVLNGNYYFKYGLADIFAGGTEVYPDYVGEVAQWFAEGQYVMHEPRATYWAYQEGINGTPLIPLIDPANESYINIGAELGLTETFDCGWVHHLRPFHDQIWLADCHTNLLVDVPALTTQEVGGYAFVAWSPDGRYALLTANDRYTLLDLDTMTFTPLPDVPATAISPVWSETADYLALTAAANDGVYVVETAVGQSRFVAVQPSSPMAWRPNSNQLALAVADGTIMLITADDGSSQILTPALPEVRDLRWSPAGMQLALVSKTNINILSFDP